MIDIVLTCDRCGVKQSVPAKLKTVYEMGADGLIRTLVGSRDISVIENIPSEWVVPVRDDGKYLALCPNCTDPECAEKLEACGRMMDEMYDSPRVSPGDWASGDARTW